MRWNLLYYHPKNADILLYSDDKQTVKEAEKYFSRILGVMLVNGGFFCEEDGLAKTLHKKYSSMLKWIAPLGIIFFICVLCFAVCSEFPHNSYWSTFFAVVGVILIIPSVALYIILGILMWRLYNYKKRLLSFYLENYTPRCAKYDYDFRDELAKCGFNTLNNRTQIEQGRRYVYSSAFAEYDSENVVTMLKCICISCKNEMNCTEISEFDNDSAVCPICGAVAVLPDFDDMISDEITDALNEYWCGD